MIMPLLVHTFVRTRLCAILLIFSSTGLQTRSNGVRKASELASWSTHSPPRFSFATAETRALKPVPPSPRHSEQRNEHLCAAAAHTAPDRACARRRDGSQIPGNLILHNQRSGGLSVQPLLDNFEQIRHNEWLRKDGINAHRHSMVNLFLSRICRNGNDLDVFR